MVSWKSADESLADVGLDDYVAGARSTRSTRSATCSASRRSTRSAIASPGRPSPRRWPCSRRGARRRRSLRATFFTAQVDFSEAGDLKLFLGDETMGLLSQVTADKGYLDGRYMAATFNLLRGRDLIWSYVVNNYLLGEEPTPFDLLHWNGDTTNLPAGWHRDYLETLYRGNKLVEKGGITRRGHADRPEHGQDADLYPGRARGPYRAARKRVEDHAPLQGRQALRARRIGAYRRRGQPAGGGEISILDQRRRSRRASPSSSRARPSIRAAGGPTGSSG